MRHLKVPVKYIRRRLLDCICLEGTRAFPKPVNDNYGNGASLVSIFTLKLFQQTQGAPYTAYLHKKRGRAMPCRARMDHKGNHHRLLLPDRIQKCILLKMVFSPPKLLKLYVFTVKPAIFQQQ